MSSSGGGEGAAGGNENNTSAAAQEAANLGIGTSASIGATSMGISADEGTAEAAGQAAGGFGTWGGNAAAIAQDIANNMTPASAIAAAVVPGYGLYSAAQSVSNVFGTGGTNAPPGDQAGGHGDGSAAVPKQQATAAPKQQATAAPKKAPIKQDPVAPAKQTISAPDSPEHIAQAMANRKRKVTRPLITGGFLGTSSEGVQTQTVTSPSLTASSSLGPGAGFTRRRNTV